MKSSIVIINKNEVGIKDTLASLNSISSAEAEIIVVDGSNHKFDDIKKQYPKVRWTDFTPKNPQKISIAEQRNVGIKMAKSGIVVFIDASCVPDNDKWLTNLIAPILDEKENIVRGSLSNIANYYTAADQVGKKIYVTEAPTINLAIKKTVFDHIGMFDESYSYGSDMDFTWRATHKAYKIRYIENAPVSHDFGDNKQNIKRYVNYGKARAKLYFNHPYYISRFKNYELQCLVYFLIICLTPIVVIFPLYFFVLLGLILFQLKGDPVKETTERFSFAWGMVQGFFSELILRVQKPKVA